MSTKLETFIKTQLKTNLPDIRPGDTVRVSQKFPSSDKAPAFAKATAGRSADKSAGKKEGERIQIFEGLVIARKHGKGITSTITVRKIISGIGTERIFPLHSPIIEKIEVVKRGKVRRAKLYYLRKAKGKRGRLKREETAKTKAQ